MKSLIWLPATAIALVIGSQFYYNTPENNGPSASLGGSFSIAGNGNANYTIDLDIPTGTNGFAPQLSIIYSSQSGNGFLGKGFSLKGISSINRTGATKFQDGFKGGINYDSNDRFSIGSSRLIPFGNKNPSYFTEGTIYHTEIESWTKITASGTSGAGPSSFTSISKTGTIYQFGATDDAQVKAVGTPFNSGTKMNSIRKWYINKETDPNGNSIIYTYTQNPIGANGITIPNTSGKGQVYPSEILYTQNEGQQFGPQRIIKFFYEARNDTAVQFVGGGSFQTMARISNIRIYLIGSSHDTELIKEYKITYDTQSSLGISRVVTIADLSANQVLFAADTYTWTNSPNKFINSQYDFAENASSSGWQGDFNGDGKTDLFVTTENTLNSILLAQDNGFASIPIIPSISLSSLQMVADFNGDGRTDLVNGNGSKCNLYLSTGNAFAKSISIEDSIYFPATINASSMWYGDFNGDGKSDIMSKSGTQSYLSFANGVGFNKYIRFGFPSLNGNTGLVGDFNGDGLADIYVNDSIYLSNWSQGNGFLAGIYAKTNLDLNSGFFADFNGDGLGDLIGKSGSQYYVYYSTGHGLNPPVKFPSGDITTGNTWLGDYNGDGLTDLLSTSQGYGIFYATGSTFHYQGIPPLRLSSHKWIGDFNGDNITDIFDAGAQLLFTNIDSTNTRQNSNQLLNSIIGIDNGLGSAIQIRYQPITNDSVYSKSAILDSLSLSIGVFNHYNSIPLSPKQISEYPIKLTQSAMYVVAEYSQTDGLGSQYHYDYAYSGAKVDVSSIGWLGFHSTLEIDSQAGNTMTTFYLQNYPLTGKVDSILTKDLNQNFLSSQKNHYTLNKIQNTPDNRIYQILNNRTLTHHYDYGTYTFTSASSTTYDYFGNPKLIITAGDVLIPDNFLYTLSNYNNDTSQWVIGQLNKTSQCRDSMGKFPLNQTAYTYFPNTRNIKVMSQWVNTSNQWLNTQYAYDPFGNCITIINPSNDTTWYAFDSLYHTFPYTTTSPPNQWGNKLQTTTIYNPAWGSVIKTIDANNNITGLWIDQFGRDSVLYIEESPGKQINTEILSYRLSKPCGILTAKLVLNNWNQTSWDTVYTFTDGLSRPYKINWKGTQGHYITQLTEYNNKNNIIRKSKPFFAGDTIYWTTKTYDPYGRLIRLVLPDSLSKCDTIRFNYSAKQVNIVEGNGTNNSPTSTLYFEYYNSSKKIIKAINKAGETTHYKYNLLGNSISVKDPAGNVSTQEYNSIGNVIFSKNPSSGINTSQYDYIHKRLITTNQSGDSMITVFDPLHRPISQFISNQYTYQFQYDLASERNGLGHLCKIIMPETACTYTYQYDAQSNVSASIIDFNGKSYVQRYVYSPDRLLTALTYPDSSVANYSYYQNGLSKQVLFLDSKSHQKVPIPFVAYEQYDAHSQPLKIVYGNKVVKYSNYLTSGNLSAYKIMDANNSAIVNQKYFWSNDNEISSIIDSVEQAFSQSFEYDPAGRLKIAQGGYGTSSFQYDQAGNLTMKDSLTFKYNNYQLASGFQGPNKKYQAYYDVNGNLSSKVLYSGKDSLKHQYQYDALNRLTSITIGNDTLYSFLYDYSGNRLKKVDHKNHIVNVYIGTYYEECITPDSIFASKYVISNSNLIASTTTGIKHTNNTATQKYQGLPIAGTLYYHQDFVNSTKVTTTNAGLLGTRINYKPYGEMFQISGDHNFRYSFGSKEFDLSGLYYFSSRYYDPFTSRFITADSRLAAGMYMTDAMNRYAYAINNPIKYFDPSGHSVLTDIEIAAFFTAQAVVDVLTDGAATVPELELDMDFFEAMRVSRRIYEQTNGAEGISEDEALKIYKGKADANSALSIDDRTSDKTLGEYYRPKAYKPMPFSQEAGIDNHGNYIYYNKSEIELYYEKADFNELVQNNRVEHSTTRTSSYHQVYEITRRTDANRPLKFTLSFDDYHLSVGSFDDGDMITHPAIESQQGGGHVYTAGQAWYQNNTLFLSNETGHYATDFNSLKMSEPMWRLCGFDNIQYVRFK